MIGHDRTLVGDPDRAIACAAHRAHGLGASFQDAIASLTYRQYPRTRTFGLDALLETAD
jgi:hypothetical protein